MSEETETTEKIPIVKRESMIHSLKRFAIREVRIMIAIFSSAFRDPTTLLKRMFTVKAVDKGIRNQAKFYELFPKQSNNIAILACHGFGATPEIYQEIGPILQSKGYYFRTIRLSGHGTSPAHMAQTSGEDWFSSVVYHYKKVSENYDRIFFLGHSLGATLGLLLSTIYPIETIIALCAPINLHIGPAKFVRQLSAFIKYWPRSKGKRKMLRESGVHSYGVSPLYAIAGIFEVGKVLRDRADKLNLPVLYVRAAYDHKNLMDQPDEFRKFFPNTPTEFRDAENSPHSVLIGPEKDMINNWIVKWFEKYN